MTYEQLKYLKPSAFKRRCGVQPESFEQMADVLRPDLDRGGKRGGQCKLSVEDQLLLVLEKGAGISDSVPHRHKLGTERVGSVPIDSEGGRSVDGVWQVPTPWQKATLSECLYLECVGGGCYRESD